ncbi:MAG: hypothetical protein HY887_01220 [Deltaproteobacteria bacterium]|nr:hypothetical protein [Deltaproteobacteria bacterium]
MKRIVMILLAAAVPLFGFSGQAMAYFTDGDLIRVVYQKGGANEVATDLGAFAPTAAYSGTGISFTTNLFPTAGAVGGAFSTAALADLQVAYFVRDVATTHAWTSGPQAGQVSGNRQWTSAFSGGVQLLQSKYATFGTAQATLLQSDTQAYVKLMDNGGINFGKFGGFIPLANGEQNLAALGTAGFVDSYLYYYATPNSPLAGSQVATLRTFADGHTEVVGASPVPIPAPVMLLGSGLMALVGIRRKQAV